MEIFVNPNWSYRQAVYNIKTLKLKYTEVLASFSSFEPRERANFIYRLRGQFYALTLPEWQRDNLWKYMNDDTELSDLILSALRYK